MTRSIVMLHPGGLGDLLLAVPAIHKLRARYPHHRTVLYAHEQGTALLVTAGLIDEWNILAGASCAALFGGAQPDDPALRECFSRCDLAVAWSRDESGSLADALARCGVRNVVVRSPFDQALHAVHQSDRFVEIVGERTTEATTSSYLVMPEDINRKAVARLQTYGVSLDRPVALVHPGSGSRHKCVKPSVLAPVIEALEARGMQVMLLEGPADRAIVEKLLAILPHPPVLLRDLSLSLLAGVLLQLDLYVGHDSGVTHLAALLGAPAVALFGPTDTARWAPRGPAVRIVQGPPCLCESWDAVTNCVKRPCLEFSPDTILSACYAA